MMIPAWCACQSFKESGVGRRPGAGALELTEPGCAEKEAQQGQESAESRAGSLRATLGAAAAHCGVGGGHLRAVSRVQALHQNQDRERNQFAGSRKTIPFVLIPWWPLVLGAGNASEALFPEYFQGLPVNVKGSRPLGPAWPLQPGSPTPYPAPACSLHSWQIFALLGTQPWAGSHGGMQAVHTHRTHTAPDQVATSSCVLDSSFPVAAVTNDHKCGSLTQQEFILFQFRRSEVWNGGVGRAGLFLQTVGENLSSPLPASGRPSLPGCKLQFLPLQSLCLLFLSLLRKLFLVLGGILGTPR